MQSKVEGSALDRTSTAQKPDQTAKPSNKITAQARADSPAMMMADTPSDSREACGDADRCVPRMASPPRAMKFDSNSPKKLNLFVPLNEKNGHAAAAMLISW